MTTLQEDFEAWFQSVELGDGDMPLPEPKDGKRWDEYVLRHALALGAVQWATERAAKQVPTSWLDSMLTGPDAVQGIDKADTRTIEALLRRIAAAIRAGGEQT